MLDRELKPLAGDARLDLLLFLDKGLGPRGADRVPALVAGHLRVIAVFDKGRQVFILKAANDQARSLELGEDQVIPSGGR